MRLPHRWIAILTLAASLGSLAPLVSLAAASSQAEGASDPASAARDRAAIDRTASASGGATPDPDSLELAASTEPAWSPGRPVAAAGPFETALRFPGRLVTLPLSGLGWLTRHAMVHVEDELYIPRVVSLVSIAPRVGVSVSPASLGDRTGFGVKVKVAPAVLGRLVSAEWDGSTLKYSRTLAEAGYGPVRLRYGYEWRPRDQFFGLGLDSHEDRTSYASQTQWAQLRLALRTPPRSSVGRGELLGWAGPREIITRSGRLSGEPSFEEEFPALDSLRNRRVEHFVYGGRLTWDGRRGVPRWSRGARVAIEASRFDDPIEALALRTSHASFRFTRLVYDAEGGISFFRAPRTFRLSVRAVDQEADGASLLPLQDLAALGGSSGLAGFEPGRFHDLDAAVARLTYLFPLIERFELDVHAEAGGVYRDLWSDARLSSLEHSFGIALRANSDTMTLGSVGLDWSRETARVRFSIGGVE